MTALRAAHAVGRADSTLVRTLTGASGTLLERYAVDPAAPGDCSAAVVSVRA